MSKRKLAFGPGTALSLVAAAGVVGYSLLEQRSTPQPSLPRVRAATDAAPPQLYKPEPSRLLKLSLNPIQAETVRSLDRSWQAEKAELETAMQTVSAPARTGPHRLDQLEGGLQDYAHLSRQYDAARQRYWEEALAVLTPEQRKEIESP